MTVFWLVAALFVVGALLFLLPPLWAPRGGGASAAEASLVLHRAQWAEAAADTADGLLDPARLRQVRREIEGRLVAEATVAERATDARPARPAALALALLIPLASVATYWSLGRPDAVVPQVEAPAAGRHVVTPEQIQQRVAALAERLRAQPDDAEGWLVLGRSYTALERYRDAVTAFRKAVDLLPPNPSLLADLADVTGMAQGRRLAGEPAKIIQKALDLDPKHPKALALAGSVAFEARDYPAARGYWERLVAVLPPDSPMQRSVRGSIAEAAQLEGGPMPRAEQVAQAPALAATAIRGEVVLSPALAARVAAGDTLFVFARAVDGPRMPLAIERRPTGGGTRFEFTLDDSMAMSPNLRLSGFPKVVVGARISKSGNATPSAGDLVGTTGVLAPGATGVRVTIDQVQP